MAGDLLPVRCTDPRCRWEGRAPIAAIMRCPNCAAALEGVPAVPAEPRTPTAADKLRELLRTRPAMPSTEDLVRWWRSSAELVREVERHNHAEAKARRSVRKDPKPTAERTDGLGNPLIADALYFVQDARVYVGNCGSWWAPNGAGYCCSIDDAGKYTGAEASVLRGTDVPWPVEYVLQHTVRHVRVDVKAFNRSNYKPGQR